MKYVSGIYALNVPCSLKTCGDWHSASLNWHSLSIKESRGTLWGDYGIEKNISIPCHDESFNVANHIRALLDLLVDGSFSYAQGMKRDFICNDSYNEEIFKLIYKAKDNPNWNQIDTFLHKEYGREWRIWKNGRINIAE